MVDFARQVRRITIARPSDELYDMVSDITRMGEWSPACRSGVWDDGAGPHVGAGFTGHNDDGARQWDMRCRVFVADPGREFAWATVGMPGTPEAEGGLTRWGYTFSSVEGGTEVEESWELSDTAIEMFEALPEEQQEMLVETIWHATLEGMETTLGNLRRVAEQG
jgi:hypothetical protein